MDRCPRKQSTDTDLQTLALNQISETASNEETEAHGQPRFAVAASGLMQGYPAPKYPSLHRKYELHQLRASEPHEDDGDT